MAHTKELPMPVLDNIVATIGRTPLIRLSRVIRSHATVLAKLESHNPLGSVKDRVGAAMIEAAWRDGRIDSESIIVEPTSGNTGISLAFVAGRRGLRCIIVMPESMSLERRKVLHALGAEVVLTDGQAGMTGAIARATAMAAEDKRIFVPQQFENPANPEIHRLTTGPEIWEDTQGQVDIFVSGVGTGGTITGVARAIKPRKASFRAVAVEPSLSPVISQTLAGAPLTPRKHAIQGIGAGFVPANLQLDLVDEVIGVSDAAAVEYARRAAREEGIFVGYSAGAALKAADEVAQRPESRGKTIVALLASYGERYLSTPLFSF
jgi:cysteine synthase A